MFPKLNRSSPSAPSTVTSTSSRQASTRQVDVDVRPSDTSLLDGLRRPRPNRASSASSSASVASNAALSSNDLALAAYLLARDMDGRRVPTADVSRLRKANDSIGNTRQLLRFGRGNVDTDLRDTHNESGWRTKAARQLKDELYMRSGGRFVEHAEQMRHSAAAAVVFGSGNCGEYASTTSVYHSSRLGAQETVHYVSGRNHSWAEARLPAEDATGSSTIVMDGWSTGPAVLAPDSRFAARREQLRSHVQLDAANGRDARIATNDVILEMRAKGPAEVQRRINQGVTFSARFVAFIDSLLPSGIGDWCEQHVLNDAFAGRVRAQLDTSPASADLLTRAERIADELGVAGTARTVQAQQIIAATRSLVAAR
ncbi:type III effector HopX1 [Xanthomonas hortorum]|uniref:type III effector HopX1 n=1 Tax=Xanthomonas hortorum TaxID=56454 RepID=UPI002935A5F7|nr:type III effector HopX1 [Xanthomonas hortorum]MDV2450602.1 type III effector HopX1 [Xanthomonas hortorum NBC5720]